MVLSARARNDGDTVGPIVLATLRLTTQAYPSAAQRQVLGAGTRCCRGLALPGPLASWRRARWRASRIRSRRSLASNGLALRTVSCRALVLQMPFHPRAIAASSDDRR